MTPDFYLAHPWFFIVPATVAFLADGRAVRLLVHEDFPPGKWLRDHWIAWTHGGTWSSVLTCHWCAAPYVVAVSIIWFALGLWLWEPALWAWWAVHAWAALSYAASWVVHHDEDGSSSS